MLRDTTLRTLLTGWLLATFLTLHSPDGSEIYVNASEIMIITKGGPPLTTPGCKSDVMVHDRWICVKETPEEVKRLVMED